jgi:predicted peptidase
MPRFSSRRDVIGGTSSLFLTVGCLDATESTTDREPTGRATDESSTPIATPSATHRSPRRSDPLTDTGDRVDGFRPGTFESAIELPFRLFVPESYRQEDRPSKPYPVVLALHGAGGRGDGNRRHITRNGKNAPLYASDRVQSNEECFVLAPQCPDGSRWSQLSGWGEGSTPMREVTPPMDTAIDLLDAVRARFPIDPDRQYVVGFSMGGYGTWDAICRYPDRFAAATPMSGGGHPDRAHLLEDVRVWAFHGAADPTVPVEGSRTMIDAMREAGLDPKYTEFTDTKHVEAATKALAIDQLPGWTLGV